MWIRCARALLAFLLWLAAPASVAWGADNPHVVVSVPTIHQLHIRNYSETEAVYVVDYATPGDGGGGYFTKVPSCAQDFGFCVKDGAATANSWLRRPDRAGPVSIKWFGDGTVRAKDYNTSECQHDPLPAQCDDGVYLTRALAASAIYGDGGVTCDGISPAWAAANVTIPKGQYIDCGHPSGGARRNLSDPIWSAPGSLVHSTAVTLVMQQGTILRHAHVRPTFFTLGVIPATHATFADWYAMRALFAGTGVSCSSESCDFEDVQINGFDRCIDQSGSPRSNGSRGRIGCNGGYFIHAGRGGAHIGDWMSKNWLMQNISNGCIDPPAYTKCQGSAQQLTYPVTAISRDSATGWVRKTIDDTLPHPTFQIVPGMRAYGSGMGTSHTVDMQADLDSSSLTITGIDTDDPDASLIKQGDQVSGSGCIPINTTVVDPPDDDGSATLSAMPTCTRADEKLTFTGAYISPPNGNGSHRVYSVDPATHSFVEEGAPYDNITVKANWNSNVQWLTVFDHTGIQVGQYLTTAATASRGAFGDPPTDWAYSATTSSTVASLGDSGLGDITVGSTANWPGSGIAKICKGSASETCSDYEVVTIKVVDLTHITILARAQDGTTTAAHVSTDAIKMQAPSVVNVVPWPAEVDGSGGGGFVKVNAFARGTQTTNVDVVFANDFTVSGAIIGQVQFSASYFDWAWDTRVGPRIGAGLKTTVASSSGTSLTLAANAWKAQPGMVVFDQTTPSCMGADHGTAITARPPDGTSQTITLATAPACDPTGHTVILAGCGYEPGKAREGNCGGVAFQVGAMGEKSNQGLTFDKLHCFGSQTCIHMRNGPATSGTIPYADPGGIVNVDPDSAGARISGNGTKINLGLGRLGGHYGIFNSPTKQVEGARFIGNQIGLPAFGGCFAVNLGPKAILQLQGNFGGGSGCLFDDVAAEDLNLSANNFASAVVDVSSRSTLDLVHCGKGTNTFANAVCSGAARGELECISGCSAVNGSDGDFSITPGVSATTIVIRLSNKTYPITPRCPAVSNDPHYPVGFFGATFDSPSQPAIVTFTTLSPVTTIYGGCHVNGGS